MCCKNGNSNKQQMREARRHARGPPCSRRSHSHVLVDVDQPAPFAPVVFSQSRSRRPTARATVGNSNVLVHVQHLVQSRLAAHQQQAAYNAPVQDALEPTRQSQSQSQSQSHREPGRAGPKEERERERERDSELAYAARWKSEKKREPMLMRREMKGGIMDDGLPPSYGEVMRQKQKQQQ